MGLAAVALMLTLRLQICADTAVAARQPLTAAAAGE
jgi:hypothetical protein